MKLPRLLPPPLFLLGGICFFLGVLPGLSAEEDGDPASRIGLRLEELISRYGAPESVHAVRGSRDWQDDVVFVYGDGDYYLYRDRVWQLGLSSAYGINVGDKGALIPLVLGDKIEYFDGYTLCSLSGRAWPLNVRFNLDRNGIITHIFIYRPDF
ncbi:MAG: hypothetical protein LBQ38_02815 [Spirochaetaceae bacterium]|jgi:hypothetical protein|nr:hypothetical protein [Spirochaetaceae bacterium]